MIWRDDKPVRAGTVCLCVCVPQDPTASGTSCPCPAAYSSVLLVLLVSIHLSVFVLKNDLGNFLLFCIKSCWVFSLTYIFSLFHVKPLFHCLSLWPSASWQRICPQVFIDQPPLFLCIYTIPSSLHPFIPPSGQPLPVLLGGCVLAGLWNETVPCCFWHLARLGRLQPSSLSLFCKTHRLIGSLHS